MSRIRVKNFGPIKEGYQENDGWMDIKKVTTFIGNQGSGKSTVAKLISTFMWIEKALYRGDFTNDPSNYSDIFSFKRLGYHRLQNYFQYTQGSESILEFEGVSFNIRYESGDLSIEKIDKKHYELPQIMYVPAERNFISYVESPKELKLSSESLTEFLTEFNRAKDALNGFTRLPINDVGIEYDDFSDRIELKGRGFSVDLTEASSGFQSLVPLYIVSQFLANRVRKKGNNSKEPMSSEELERFKKGIEEIYTNEDFSEEQKRAAISVLTSRFNKTAFINIVEEPEQNLFPASQWQMLQSLLKFNNMSPGNKLIMTTHSPYIINFLSIAIQGFELKRKIEQSGKSDKLLSRLKNVISLDALIPSEDSVVYQLDEHKGTIQKLSSPEGIPSDRNYLNDMLREGNILFDTLLEIEEEI
ncbi:ATPase AAA [Sporocytophaga myxococcoides]|uniref:ATPase AAA n=1 Tax=Sporocytophaga myxococcoides TaxID=153721 RepID=A0A098LF20_9BACT|nr:AAA family ATPase [Sporocytophaga myxococcoides]GAL85566.1 ATPase AAA [Sporocytophaga myxococcoides]